MAVAAELLTPIRPPELEVYGRSLSTIHYLGLCMVRSTYEESILSPEADQARVEFYTSVEEGFGTDEELGSGLEVRGFEYRTIIDGKIMSKDTRTKRAISDMTEAGLIRAEVDAEQDEHFRPQLIRTQWDHENALISDQMAQGKTDYNTRIVVSPFPEEAAAISGDDYWRNIGYVPSLRRGFVQLYHTTEAGEVLTGTLSFDGSDKVRLREVFSQYGIDIPETEVTDNWLRYAITGTVTEDAARALAGDIADQAKDPVYEKTTNTVDITEEHRAIMDAVFDQSYVHACESLARGFQTLATRKLVLRFANEAQHFNERYATALYGMRANAYKFTDDDMAVMHELLVYSAIEMMRDRHLSKVEGQSQYEYSARDFEAFSIGEFQSILSSFAANGAMHNRVYSACGLSISLGEGVSKEGGPQDVFGGVDSEQLKAESTEDCEFVSKQCPMCGAKDVKTKVQSKGGRKIISGSCGCVKRA